MISLRSTGRYAACGAGAEAVFELATDFVPSALNTTMLARRWALWRMENA
jgi:hypothetical protein